MTAPRNPLWQRNLSSPPHRGIGLKNPYAPKPAFCVQTPEQDCALVQFYIITTIKCSQNTAYYTAEILFLQLPTCDCVCVLYEQGMEVSGVERVSGI